MPLKRNPELEEVINEIDEATLRNTRSASIERISFCAVALIVVAFVLELLRISASLKSSLMLVACSIGVMIVINARLTTIQRCFAAMATLVEWLGRKHLGEDE